MYWGFLSTFSLWDGFSIWSAPKANIYLNFKSKRNSSILFLVLFPLILKVINFQWQLIISEEKAESIWLFGAGLAKCFLIGKSFCSMHFNPFCTVFIIQDSYYNHDLSSNDRISHREKNNYFNKKTLGL